MQDVREIIKREVMQTRGSRKIYFPIYLMITVVLAGLVIAYSEGIEIDRTSLIICAVFAIAGIKFAEVHRLKHKYEINPRVLIHTEGYFAKTSRRLDLFAISDIDVSQTFWQRILNFGDVNVRLFSKESVTHIKNINSPHEFADFLERKMKQIRIKSPKKEIIPSQIFQ